MAAKKTSSRKAPATTAKSGAGGGGELASARIVLLHGKEPFLRFLKTGAMREALEAAHGEVEVIRFDGATAQVADVLDECRSFGLMQRHKLVVVDDADEFVKEATRPLLERYAQSPAEGATLVLRGETWRAGKLDGLIQAVGVIEKCEPKSRAEAIKWAVNRCSKRKGATIEPEAAELLVDRLGSDLGRIDSELSKLAAAAPAPKGKHSAGDAGPIITPDLVRELVGVTREDEVWPLQPVFVSGSAEASLRTISQLVNVSRQDPVFLSYVMADLARKLHTASCLLHEGMYPDRVAGIAKLWASKQQLLEVARRADPGMLADLLKEAVEADARCKSGLADPLRSVEALAIRFASV